jgi:hypothetical protein
MKKQESDGDKGSHEPLVFLNTPITYSRFSSVYKWFFEQVPPGPILTIWRERKPITDHNQP